MRTLTLTAIFAVFTNVAYAENLFLDIPNSERDAVIERNFDYYHKVVFDSLDSRSRLVRFNGDLFDERNSDISVMFFADLPQFTVKNKGVQGNNKRSAYGYWIGDIGNKHGTRTMDVRKGKYGSEIQIGVLLQYLDVETNEYRDAPGWYSVKKMIKSHGQENYIGPVPADTRFIYRVIVSDILIHDLSQGWTKYRIQSLPHDPEYVLVTIPDSSKEFGVIEGDVDAVLAQRIEQYRQDFKKYKEEKEAKRK